MIKGVRRPVSHIVIEKTIRRELKSNEVVHHKDRNPQNNEANNLQLMTRSEHITFHGREEGKGQKKLSFDDVRVIRKMLKGGTQQWLIAWVYEVGQATISKIKRGRCWGWMN